MNKQINEEDIPFYILLVLGLMTITLFMIYKLLFLGGLT
jgi:hypothetical protein